VICFFARRRLGAYLDGALDAGAYRAMTSHVEACRSCRREIEGLRHMRALLRGTLVTVAEPDWSGFWPGIVRGVQDGTERRVIPERPRWSRRWILSGAAAAAVAVLSIVMAWPPPGPAEEPVVVTAANTQYPGGTMVYHTPEKMAVVWVFDE
jgi:anti-sigma factor RsiW